MDKQKFILQINAIQLYRDYMKRRLNCLIDFCDRQEKVDRFDKFYNEVYNKALEDVVKMLSEEISCEVRFHCEDLS